MPKAVLATVLAVIAAALVTVGSAVAAPGGTGHTVTQTDNFHGVQTTTDTNPCTGNEIDLTETSNIVQHITFFPGGDEIGGRSPRRTGSPASIRERELSTPVTRLFGATSTSTSATRMTPSRGRFT